MKKLVAIVAILAMAVSANAGVIGLQIVGTGATAGSIVAIAPTDVVTVDPGTFVSMNVIWTAPTDQQLFSISSMLTAVGDGTLSSALATYPTNIWDTGSVTGFRLDSPTQLAMWTGGKELGLMGTGSAAVAIFNIQFQANDDSVLTLAETDQTPGGLSLEVNGAEITYGGPMTINMVVPEPMTLGLLGLGGLFLRRRLA